MSLEILPYSTPTGIRHYVPLEDYQRALDNLDKLENENMAVREAIKEAYALVNDVYLEADNYADGAPDAEFYAKLSNNFAHLLKPALTKLQPFLTQPK